MLHLFWVKMMVKQYFLILLFANIRGDTSPQSETEIDVGVDYPRAHAGLHPAPPLTRRPLVPPPPKMEKCPYPPPDTIGKF